MYSHKKFVNLLCSHGALRSKQNASFSCNSVVLELLNAPLQFTGSDAPLNNLTESNAAVIELLLCWRERTTSSYRRNNTLVQTSVGRVSKYHITIWKIVQKLVELIRPECCCLVMGASRESRYDMAYATPSVNNVLNVYRVATLPMSATEVGVACVVGTLYANCKSVDVQHDLATIRQCLCLLTQFVCTRQLDVGLSEIAAKHVISVL